MRGEIEFKWHKKTPKRHTKPGEKNHDLKVQHSLFLGCEPVALIEAYKSKEGWHIKQPPCKSAVPYKTLQEAKQYIEARFGIKR